MLASRTGATKLCAVCLTRVEHRNDVRAVFRGAVERPISVDRRITPIRSDQIVQILFFVEPIPGRDDDIALGALGPRGFVCGSSPLAMRSVQSAK